MSDSLKIIEKALEKETYCSIYNELEDHLVHIKLEHEVEVNDTNTEEYWCGVKKGLEVAIATIQNRIKDI